MQQGVKTIAFIGGKGGVGTSSVVANSGVLFALSGKSTVIADGDPFAQSLYALIGFKHLPENLFEVYMGDEPMPLDSYFVETSISGVKLLPYLRSCGFSPERDYSVRPDIMSKFSSLEDVEFILLDLGNHPDSFAIDFWLHSDLQVLVCSPEPAAIVKTNIMLDLAFRRLIETYAQKYHIEALLAEAIVECERNGEPMPIAWIEYLKNSDPIHGGKIADRIGASKVYLLMNRVRNSDDMVLASDLQFLWNRHFGVQFELVGGIAEDIAMSAAAREGKPVVIMLQDAQASQDLDDALHGFLFMSRQEWAKGSRERLISQTGSYHINLTEIRKESISKDTSSGEIEE